MHIVHIFSVPVTVILLASSIRILKEYERGVILRPGRVRGTSEGPAPFPLIPVIDRMANNARKAIIDVENFLYTSEKEIVQGQELRAMLAGSTSETRKAG